MSEHVVNHAIVSLCFLLFTNWPVANRFKVLQNFKFLKWVLVVLYRHLDTSFAFFEVTQFELSNCLSEQSVCPSWLQLLSETEESYGRKILLHFVVSDSIVIKKDGIKRQLSKSRVYVICLSLPIIRMHHIGNCFLQPKSKIFKVSKYFPLRIENSDRL
jgi:hypothetical protein